MCRIVVAICLLALVIPFAVPTSAAEPDRYGYTLLTSDKQRAAYRVLADGIGNMSETIDLSSIGITEADLDIVSDMVLSDYPEYFWYSGAYYLTVGEVVISFTPATRANGSDELVKGYGISGIVVNKNTPELVAAQNAFQNAVNTALAQIPAGASDYQKTEILHDYLAGVVSYQFNADDQTAYGALVMGTAVCAGYTRAYQLLLNRAGIRSWYVSGQSYSPHGQLVAHAWNLVWLDGCCYYTDVTWDDQGERLFHHYLNLSLEQMQTGHFTNNPVPASCGHTAYTYFKMNAAPGKGICDMNGSESGADIAKYFALRSLSGDQAVYTCNIHYHGSAFDQWMANQISGIVEELGLVENVGYSYSHLGMEYQVTLTGTAKDPSSGTPEPLPPAGGGEETPQPNTPPAGSHPSDQPSQQPVPTPSQPAQQPAPTPSQPAQQPEQQPTEQTTPPTQPATQDTTQPTTDTEPTGTHPTDNAPSSPSTDPTTASKPSEPALDKEEEPTSPVIPIVVSVVVLAGGATVFILIKKKR